MKLGVHIGYWGLGLSADEQLKLVREAESLGYDSVWTAEAYGSDAATILGWLAQATERIRLGSAIFQMPGRSAAMTAMTAATLDQLSDGRMLLGIGSSGPQIADGWIPTLFSPEHVGEFRPLLEEGFAKAGDGKGFEDFDIAPSVNVFVSDDRESARDAMRPYVALYVGGMGSRKQNFYNALVQRYGFEDAA